MNIHEYQAKKVLAQYGINVPKGGIAYTPAEAKRVAQKISARGPWMLKAQIQAGARANGYFSGKKGGKGGIRQITQIANIPNEASQMLNKTLITSQTGPHGRLVSKVYVEEFADVKHLFYAGMIIDSSAPAITLLISDDIIENIIQFADMGKGKFLRIPLHYDKGISDEKIYEILNFLSLDKSYLQSFHDFFGKVLFTFINLDATMIEINPVGITPEKKLLAIDAKINFDDNALFRHPDIVKMHDDYEEDERTLRAKRYGFQYNEFNGNIGCIINGEGLALAAMDTIKSHGGGLACSLNIKGGVDKEKIANGIKLIMTNPRIEGVFINILGGFMRCNMIAEGIISASQDVGLSVPMVVRFEGTNKEEAIAILQQSNLPVIFAENTDEAAEKLIAQMEVND
ncbi:MAG: ADP-forming succinate--CoA ligase subunit beta [Alphaproteobacteria bacterium]|nr:ADP-forming succinate--CoA ligase subunit beta [Alphaproteobacteria bacterium]